MSDDATVAAAIDLAKPACRNCNAAFHYNHPEMILCRAHPPVATVKDSEDRDPNTPPRTFWQFPAVFKHGWCREWMRAHDA